MNWRSRFILVNAGFALALVLALYAGYVRGIAVRTPLVAAGSLLGSGISLFEYRFRGFSFDSPSTTSALIGVVPLLALMYVLPPPEALVFLSCFTGSFLLANLVLLVTRVRRTRPIQSTGA